MSNWNAIKYLWKSTWLIRGIVGTLSFFALIGGLYTVVYQDYLVHRDWATKRISQYYSEVEEVQGQVLIIATKTIPSRATADQLPTRGQVEELRAALIDLSTKVSAVDANSSEMSHVSHEYLDSISKFVKALVRLEESEPRTRSDLLFAAHRWDIAAKKFSITVENRIQSYRSTILPSS